MIGWMRSGACCWWARRGLNDRGRQRLERRWRASRAIPGAEVWSAWRAKEALRAVYAARWQDRGTARAAGPLRLRRRGRRARGEQARSHHRPLGARAPRALLDRRLQRDYRGPQRLGEEDQAHRSRLPEHREPATGAPLLRRREWDTPSTAKLRTRRPNWWREPLWFRPRSSHHGKNDTLDGLGHWNSLSAWQFAPRSSRRRSAHRTCHARHRCCARIEAPGSLARLPARVWTWGPSDRWPAVTDKCSATC